MTAELIVTVADMQAVGMCSRGGRQWAACRGLDWSLFLRHGLPVSAIEQVGDELSARVVAAARARATGDDE